MVDEWVDCFEQNFSSYADEDLGNLLCTRTKSFSGYIATDEVKKDPSLLFVFRAFVLSRRHVIKRFTLSEWMPKIVFTKSSTPYATSMVLDDGEQCVLISNPLVDKIIYLSQALCSIREIAEDLHLSNAEALCDLADWNEFLPHMKGVGGRLPIHVNLLPSLGVNNLAFCNIFFHEFAHFLHGHLAFLRSSSPQNFEIEAMEFSADVFATRRLQELSLAIPLNHLPGERRKCVRLAHVFAALLSHVGTALSNEAGWNFHPADLIYDGKNHSNPLVRTYNSFCSSIDDSLDTNATENEIPKSSIEFLVSVVLNSDVIGFRSEKHKVKTGIVRLLVAASKFYAMRMELYWRDLRPKLEEYFTVEPPPVSLANIASIGAAEEDTKRAAEELVRLMRAPTLAAKRTVKIVYRW